MKIILFLFLSLQFACSNQSKNNVKEGNFVLKGGKLNQDFWEDEIKFKRTTWFTELTMVFDLYLAKVDDSSPFYNWLGVAEKSYIKDRCQSVYLALSYSMDSEKISQPFFKEQMSKVGLSQFTLTDFKSHLRLHPQYEPANLRLYQINGYCAEKLVDENSFLINLPGFNTTSI
jgi:hypothetical protein